MRLISLFVALLGLALHAPAHAQPTTANGFNAAPGAPVTVLSLPFERADEAFAFPVSTTPQTYAISQPIRSGAYRGSNACPVDVVIGSVTASLPVATEPVVFGGETIPNVQRVTSPTGSVNRFTGTFFFARSGRVLGSSRNPMGGQIRYVSVMALADPGASPCLYRLHYGGGS